MTQEYLNKITYSIIGCAIEVHRALGPGLMESVYEACMAEEFNISGLLYARQQKVPIIYKGKELGTPLRYDFVVNDSIVVELKAVDEIHPLFQAKLLTYMRLLQKPKGIIINFNCTNIYKEGQLTMVNEFYRKLPLK